ncbi:MULTISPECIES: STAS domain-containing protein [Pseudorhizobium]|jgi:chemotaxis protein CheX|uniref:Chemotaxis protein CheX n=1 Tax=Pseudorhizobium pelagicum TaxID=1509405 RepID=A0A922P516_9HYPH|nr:MULTISPECIES: STAS domain-containing protein [Pseudorhizobium]MBA4785696.1 STAS domain-containing protein [Hyphomicrobiales bacterium]MBU1313988.1 STAS domain-containing protein [Alphaproteobacteria bacterium]MDY6961956.1 STAS domain-containing protein [Pseudomonadota bacterium]KEQ05779.1 chemotaxis protein CheX [Pseudorhizobium pelagicum]KEQ10723.1 chemotaxis protein CheX [Pseudorhizobium pelagicum]|tara:strand:+ start:5317 stop:5616 length:300 start_codon:yes stop_codon:yes gene_type:complete
MATKKAASGSLKLSPVLDLTEASALHGTLMSMRGRNVTIDASEVERVGVQCVQVLIAGARAWQADKKSYVVDKSSDAFAKTMQLIGIDTDLLVAKEISK